MTDDDALDSTVDAVVVGGGPAGAAAAVFLARYGLETVVFDRGTASLDRCAFLENYPGFPAGIDVDTFQDLLAAQIRESDAELVPEMVERVEHVERDVGVDRDEVVDSRDVVDDSAADPNLRPELVVETAAGRRVGARYVVAATRYDGEYLRPVVGDDAFETHEHGGDVHEHFDPDYPDAEGRTPVDGLYVASPAGERDVQAVVAAGRGAHVARAVVEDRRADRGFPGPLAKHYDWVRPDSEFSGEWADRDRWRESFEERAPDDHDLSEEAFAARREEYVERAFETRRSDDEIEASTERAHRRLLEFVDDELIRERAAELEAQHSGDGSTDRDR